MIGFGDIRVLTFDCFGTLIDWETGILVGLRPMLGDATDSTRVLETYGRAEAAIEAGPYLPYRAVLTRTAQAVCQEFGVTADESELAAFVGHHARWPAFPDSVAALARLKRRFRLAAITNCDDDLFAASSATLGDPFTWIVTAQQAGAYKPDPRPFELALSVIGQPRERIVHVAQSLYHDQGTAKALGLRTVWVDRRRGQPGSGATPPASAQPDLIVGSLAELADLVLAP